MQTPTVGIPIEVLKDPVHSLVTTVWALLGQELIVFVIEFVHEVSLGFTQVLQLLLLRGLLFLLLEYIHQTSVPVFGFRVDFSGFLSEHLSIELKMGI